MESGAPGGQRVVLAGIDMPFGDLVVLLIKLAVASIPAALIVYVILFLITLVFMAIFGGLGMMSGAIGF